MHPTDGHTHRPRRLLPSLSAQPFLLAVVITSCAESTGSSADDCTGIVSTWDGTSTSVGCDVFSLDLAITPSGVKGSLGVHRALSGAIPNLELAFIAPSGSIPVEYELGSISSDVPERRPEHAAFVYWLDDSVDPVAIRSLVSGSGSLDLRSDRLEFVARGYFPDTSPEQTPITASFEGPVRISCISCADSDCVEFDADDESCRTLLAQIPD